MNLFEPDQSYPISIFAHDGQARYFGPILNPKAHADYLVALSEDLPWEQDELIIFGRKIITQRKTAWFGDKAFVYTYSHSTKTAQLWTPKLKQLKQLVEEKSGAKFNACLLNLYHDGSEGMGWHSDDEDSIVPDSAIASLSLGATRPFDFRHKNSKEKRRVVLEGGSLLVMQGECQRFWQHSLPKAMKVRGPRINLTFRLMREV